MARIVLDFADSLFCYRTQMTVRVTEINGANHLGNDAMISLISEARARFLYHFGVHEPLEGGLGVIVTDLSTCYLGQSHVRDVLRFEVGMTDFNRYGGDIIFRITRPADGARIAMAKTGFVFFDYATSKVVAMPESFRGRFPQAGGAA